MTIKLLPQNLINQIAAGEVIERPSSVIKELMENAIDAGADEIVVKVIDAGKSFISVSDNGIGMDKESLELCVLSHATSKLDSNNLFDIRTFGFRGEALPSIASVSRLSITSANDSEAWTINLEGPSNLGLSLANRRRGTTVEVRDLFFATPARLKFLKSDASELSSCLDAFNRSALAFPDVAFRFFDGNKQKFSYEKNRKRRVYDVLGESFEENAFEINAEKDGLKLHGFVGVPTFNKASANFQYFFVNNRFVKDKNFMYALKSAYSGLVPVGRYAAAVLFLDMPYGEVDVNAHPAKVEVRFRDAERIRFFVLSELKKNLSSFGAMKPTTSTVDTFSLGNLGKRDDSFNFKRPAAPGNEHSRIDRFPEENYPIYPRERDFPNPNERPLVSQKIHEEGKISLGNAIHQVGSTYIIAENGDDLVIVDQHAAAERITLEKLKNNLSLDSQNLLLPEICPLNEAQIEQLEKNKDILQRFGIHLEKLTSELVSVDAIPAILGSCDAKSLLNDLVDEFTAFGDAYSMDEKIYHVLSTISCHGSLRAGRKLTIQEMNSLLRQMENTANIAQCCHGRPSYVVLSIKNLNKFFERS
ncbi:MAG: DNA mismatch repair endonuclease MutL [Holosporaceae bacterium]|nr:DNA mismatch repair endonuclease MutL [Holosporaceae bacterium]